MEERGSECDLMHERFDRPLDYGWFVIEHGLEMRSNNWQHQDVVLSVYALYLEMVQESEDVIKSGMRACPGCKMTMDLDLAIPSCELSDGELEGNIPATLQRDR